MRFITDLADQAVVLPVVVAIGIALLAQGWRRGAAASLGRRDGVMILLKLVFIACPVSMGAGNLRTPSGHVAAAAIVAGGLAALLLRRPRPALIVAVLAAVVIGISRLALGAHSMPEVMVGAGVGLGGALALISLAGTTRDPARPQGGGGRAGRGVGLPWVAPASGGAYQLDCLADLTVAGRVSVGRTPII
jgi:membrane-associated phospholipid phosphatase